MSAEKPIVKADGATFGKTLLGDFRVDYSCPRCNGLLASNTEAIASGDNCPTCGSSFSFDDEIKKAVSDFLLEKKEREEKRAAEKVEKQRLRQRQREEEARATVAAQLASYQRREADRAEQWQRLHQEQGRRDHNSAQEARSLDGPYGCLTAALVMGGFGVGILLLASFAVFSNSNSLNGYEQVGFTLFVSAVSLAFSLTIVYVLFRFLKAIHSLLVLIADRLSESSDES